MLTVLITALALAVVGALLVPDVGEARLLANALGKATPPDNVYLGLYTSNTTPAEGDTLATYTEASGGGYARKTLAKGSWTVATATGTTTASFAEQTFTFTGALDSSATIYGYFVVDTADNTLLWAEKAGATFQPSANGDTYKVTPQFTQA